jgi:glycolate oxidase FAD binding subunit
MLGFEPPHFGPAATLGGTLACGLSGPRRPYAGSARDFVLGATIVNGAGEVLEFGGQVMKNVAGYDLSRLMVGAFGTLGVLLEVSLKVLPRPARELTLAFELGAAEALRRMNDWAGRPLPLSAAGHLDGRLYLRLSGSEQGVAAARAKLGGEPVNDGDTFWRALREHELDFFAAWTPLWRLSLPPAAPPLDLSGRQLIDWGGAQRWLASDAPATTIQAAAAAAGGYATPFRHGPGALSAFTGLDPTLRALHARLQRAFDPRGVFARALALDAAA